MKELFDKFERMELACAKGLNLIDTCFFISVFEKQKNKEFEKIPNKAMTSFNVLELIHVEHRLTHMKHAIRKFLHETDLKIINIDVKPGEKNKEIEFVNSVNTEILKYCKDPSDAVLIATAIKTESDILTKDKHHIFNTVLENYTNKKKVHIYKELKDVL